MLNTYLQREVQKPKNAEPLFSLMVKAEGGEEVKIEFWKDNDSFGMNYNFLKIDENKHLQMFEEYAKGRFYKIAKEDVEGIINVIKRRKY